MHGLLIRLLCVCFLTAALDRVPDPPGVNPKEDRAAAVCAHSPLTWSKSGGSGHVRTWATALRNSPLTSRSRCIALFAISQPKGGFTLRPDVRRAADSSPPFRNV